MSFKIGLFSLKQNVGCTALAIHIANFLAEKERVALIEQTGNMDQPEFHMYKGQINEDGTYNVNNVHYYPEQKIINESVWPLEYETLNLPIEESIQVYDFGAINFMFDFPEDIDKFYLVTDSEEINMNDIQSFYQDLIEQDVHISFDVVITGSSREIVSSFKNALPYIPSIIGVADKKEDRINYMLAMKIQIFMRSMNIAVPEYRNWEYERVDFYSEEEWIKEWQRRNRDKSDSKRKNGFFISKPKKKNTSTLELEKEPIVVEESDVNLNKSNEVRNANVFESFEFDIVPAPTAPEMNESSLKEKLINNRDEQKKNSRVMSVRPEPIIPESRKEENVIPEEEIDLKAAIVKASEAFEPKKMNDDISGEYKEHIVYEHKEKAAGLLGEIIEGINRGGHFCCNLFIATKTNQLFVFSSIDVFFEKLDVLKSEIGNSSNIHYGVLTYNNENRRPLIISNDKSVKMDTYNQILALLDNELRTNRNFTDADIKNHRELALFDEILYA